MDEGFQTSVTWTLASYFSGPDGPDLTAFLDALQADVEALQDETKFDPEHLPGLLLRLESLEGRLGHLTSYLYCVRSADPGNAAAKAALTAETRLRGAIEAAASEVAAALGALDNDAFEQVVAYPSLEGLEWRLRSLRRLASSRLSAEEERITGDLLEDSLHGWSSLAEGVLNDLVFEIDVPGAPTRSATFAERLDYFWSSDAASRRAAYYGLKAALGRVETVLAACLNGMTGARASLLRRRGLDVIDEVTARMSVSRDVIETMMAVSHDRRTVLLRYLDLKRTTLGLASLEVPDRWAPLTRAQVLQPQAVLDKATMAFDNACPALGEAVRTMRRNRWINFRAERERNGSGFCVYSPLHGEPRVHLNLAGSFMGQTVTAHELGHAFHFMVMDGLRPWRRLVPPTLAETASIAAEHLYRAGLLEDGSLGPEQRTEVLCADLDAAVNYLVRIPRDYDFERAIYTERAASNLTADRLKALARQAHDHWFGEAYAPDGDEYAWTAPLMFSAYTGFLNFPYTFGYLLSRAIADHVMAEGATATDDFIAFLRATGSMSAEDAARSTLGFDLTQRSFWERAYSAIETRVDAFAAQIA